MQTESVDRSRVIAGGLSQGGSLAIQLALTGDPIPAIGFVAVVPAIRSASFDELIPSAAQRGVRGVLISGELDYGRAEAEALHPRLTAAGIACRLDVVPGLSHDLPAGFESRLPTALDFILNTIH